MDGGVIDLVEAAEREVFEQDALADDGFEEDGDFLEVSKGEMADQFDGHHDVALVFDEAGGEGHGSAGSVGDLEGDGVGHGSSLGGG